MLVRALALAVLLLALNPAFAAAGLTDTVEQRIPLSGIFTNDCRAETFVVAGYFHTKAHIGIGLDGRLHMSTEFNLESVKGTAIISGARYIFAAETSRSWNSDADGAPQEGNYKSDVIMNRLGEDGIALAGDDLKQHVLAHYTVDANGVTRVDRYEVRFECS